MSDLSQEDIRDIARVIHAANWAYNISLHDTAPDPVLLDVLPQWHQEQVMRRVELIAEGYGPEEIHRVWVDEMLSRGWVLGDIKDPSPAPGNPPTHTCLKEWRELPPYQQVKDTIAIAIARNLIGARKACRD